MINSMAFALRTIHIVFFILFLVKIPGECSLLPSSDSLPGMTAPYDVSQELFTMEKENLSIEPTGVQRQDTLLIRSLNLLNKGAYDTTIAIARRYLNRFPNSVAANEILGAGLALKGNLDEGMKFLQKAVDLDPKECSALTKIGDIYLAKKNVNAARGYFKKAVECSPADGRAHQRLGLLCEQDKDYTAAIDHYERGLNGTDATYIGIKINLANLYNSSKQYDKTLKLLQGLVTPDVKNIFAHMAIGDAYLGAQKPADAVREFQIVRELAPKDPRVSLLLGIGYRATGDLANSEKSLLEALSLNPQLPMAQFQLAETFKAAQKYQKALECYEKLEGLKQILPAKKGRADLYLKQNDIPKAIAVYEDLLGSKIADFETYDLLITACQTNGKLDKAEKYALELQARFPKNPLSYYRLGIYYSFAMKYKEAVAQLEKALAMAPGDVLILKALSLSCNRLGNCTRAIAYANQIVKIHPDDSDNMFYYAALLQDAGDSNAIAVYRELLIRKPEHKFALNNLALLIMEKGNFQDALKYSEKAAVLDDQNGNILDTYGWVLYKNNDKKKSLSILQKAQSLLPENPSVLYHLAIVYKESGKKSKANEVLKKLLALKADFKQRANAAELYQKLQ
jgi:tetratricopeptide (TPR) repeat protein